MYHKWGDEKCTHNFSRKNLWKETTLEDKGVNTMVVWKNILRKTGEKFWTGFIWLGIGWVGRCSKQAGISFIAE
jgi:hypothetical protein